MTKPNDKPKPPNTISDEQWQSLQDREAKANKRHLLDPAESRKRRQSRDQRSKSRWS